jgi:hypothetical protein
MAVCVCALSYHGLPFPGQVYNETIRDLLVGSDEALELREDPIKGPTVAGVSEVEAVSTDEVGVGSQRCPRSLGVACGTTGSGAVEGPRPLAHPTRPHPALPPPAVSRPLHLPPTPWQVISLLSKGNKNRMQEPTAANKESSRSHAVLQVCTAGVGARRACVHECVYGRA